MSGRTVSTELEQSKVSISEGKQLGKESMKKVIKLEKEIQSQRRNFELKACLLSLSLSFLSTSTRPIPSSKSQQMSSLEPSPAPNQPSLSTTVRSDHTAVEQSPQEAAEGTTTKGELPSSTHQPSSFLIRPLARSFMFDPSLETFRRVEGEIGGKATPLSGLRNTAPPERGSGPRTACLTFRPSPFSFFFLQLADLCLLVPLIQLCSRA